MFGDSLIDNGVFVASPDEDVASQLRRVLPDATVENLAISGSTTASLLQRQIPIITERSKSDQSIGEHSTYFALSIGGNDIKDELLRTNGSLSEAAEAAPVLRERFTKIVEELLSINKNVMLIIPYFPGFDFTTKANYHFLLPSLDKASLVTVYRFWISEILLPLARKYQLAIVDLSNTFPVYQTDLYAGTDLYHGSSKGSMVIAQLIAYIVQDKQQNSSSYRYFIDPLSHQAQTAEATQTIVRLGLEEKWKCEKGVFPE